MNIPGKPTHIETADFSRLSLTIAPPRPGVVKKYGSTYFFKYNDGPARFFFPPMRLPFGIKASDIYDSVGAVFELTEGSVVCEKLQELYERIIQLVEENKQTLYARDGATLTSEEIRKRVSMFIKYSDKGYPPSFRANIDTDKEDPEKVLSLAGKSLLIDENGETIPVTKTSIQSIVGRNSHIKPVIEIKQMFISTANATHIKFRMSHAQLLSSSSDQDDWDMAYGDENTMSGFDALTE